MARRRLSLRTRLALAWHEAWLPGRLRPLLRPMDPWQDWLLHNRLNDVQRHNLQSALRQAGTAAPGISVVMPVFQPDRRLLAEAVASVRSQIHDRWELCVCDDGSADPDLTAELASLSAEDPRIRVVRLGENGGISRASNAAAALATKDVLLFLDQDDLLTEDCLAVFALAFAEDVSLDLAYSDNDKIGMDGSRHAPAFKPGWSPTLLLSHMYMGHAVAIRRSLFEAIGGFRPAHDGAQDFDLALRAAEMARRVGHVPRVLYHWRTAPGSTAVSAAAKPESILAGQQAVAEAISRRGIAARVERPAWASAAGIGLFGLAWNDAPPCLAIVLADSGSQHDAMPLVELNAQMPPGSETVVADPADTLAAVLDAAAGRPVLLLAAGTRPVGTQAIKQLVGHCRLPGVGLAAARLVRPDGRIAGTGLVLPQAAAVIEPGLGGMSSRGHGPSYRARVPHECLAVSAEATVITPDMVAPLAARLASAGHGFAIGELGPWLSAEVRALGRSVICAASVSMIARAMPPPDVAKLNDDIWCNPNLGRGHTQWQPARVAPDVRPSKPPRLVVVTHDLHQEGAQTALVDLLTGLKQAGHADPQVISPKTGPLGPVLERAGIAVTLHDFPSRRASKASLANHTQALAKRFRKMGADVVLANTLETHAAILAAADAGLAGLWWQHEGGEWRHYFRHLSVAARARAFAAFGAAYRVIQVADATRAGWLPLATRENFATIRHAMPRARVTHLQGAIGRAEARATLQLPTDDFTMVLVGSLSRRKAQHEVIEAFGLLPPEVAATSQVLIVGRLAEPSYDAMLAEALGQLPAALRPRIRLIGEMADPAASYAAADVFVSCSRQESAPRAIVEAMLCGLPIVATPVDGVSELVNFGRNALAYTPGDPAGLALLLHELATSRERRLSLGEAGRKQAAIVNNHDQLVSRFGLLIRQAAGIRGQPVGLSG